MPKKLVTIIIGILLWGGMKFLGIEVKKGEAEAAPAVIARTPTAKLKKVKSPKSSKQNANAPKQATPQEVTSASESPSRRMSRQEAYCRLLAAGVNVENSDLKLVYLKREPVWPQDNDLTVYIQTPDCPMDSFSKFDLDRNNRILSALDCHEATKEDLALNSALQSEIIYLGPRKEKLDVAISGPGMFLLKCGDEIRYSRSGNWDLSPEGALVTKDGACQVLDRQGRIFEMQGESHLSDQGCNSQGECLAVAQPEAGKFEVLDRKTFLALEDPIPSLLPQVRLMMNSLENLQDPQSGILGPDFESLPYLDKPEWCPDKFD